MASTPTRNIKRLLAFICLIIVIHKIKISCEEINDEPAIANVFNLKSRKYKRAKKL